MCFICAISKQKKLLKYSSGSVYSVIAVAIERYFNICKPFHRNLWSVCEGWGYISLVIIFSILYNVTKFLEFKTYYVREDPEDVNR